MDGYASTFTTIGTLLTTQTQNRTVTLNSTSYILDRVTDQIYRSLDLFWLFLICQHAFEDKTLTSAPPVKVEAMLVATALCCVSEESDVVLEGLQRTVACAVIVSGSGACREKETDHCRPYITRLEELAS